MSPRPTPAHFDPGAIAAGLVRDGRVRVHGLTGSSPAFLVASVASHMSGPLLWVTPDDDEAARVQRELTTFLGTAGDRSVLLYPGADVDPYRGLSPHAELARRRIEILARLMDGKPDVVVAPVSALLRRTLPRRILGNAQELLMVGEEIDRDRVVASLTEWGYLSTDLTEDPGCFSVRGHVLDVYPPGYESPLRVELWGDEIESLRFFDPATQRSLLSVEETVLLPVREEILSPDAVARFVEALSALSSDREIPPRQRARLQEEARQGRYFAGIEDYLPLFYPALDSLFEFLPATATVVLGGTEAIDQRIGQDVKRIRRAFDTGEALEALVPEPDGLYLTGDQLRESMGRHTALELPALGKDDDEEAIELATWDHASLRAEILGAREREGGMLTPLTERLDRWQDDGLKVLLACHSRVQVERLGALLAEREVPWTQVDVPIRADELNKEHTPLRLQPGAVTAVVAPGLDRGFGLPAAGLVLLAQAEIFGQRRRPTTARRDRLGHALTSFSEIKSGDFVVHAQFGIARYEGMHKIETPKSQGEKRREFLERARDPSYQVGQTDVGRIAARGSQNDYLLLKYRGGDRLYVPVHKLDLLHRYAAMDGVSAKLDRLGGQGWSRRRRKVEEAVQKLAAQLLDLYASREASQGLVFDPPDTMYREFAASFPFEETGDQLEAIRSLHEDLQQPQPMDRLLCGDVGYGKTEVALRAVFQVVASGYQVAVLVPTTILALQHYQTFTERLESFPISVDMLSRFRSAKEKREVGAHLKSGGLDVVIGTHAMLGKDISFKRLGLLVIDEEHRFGVKQKERIKELKRGVDVLTMTATPIPRTLNMALGGIRSFSLIDTPPEGRQEVRTFIVRFNPQRVKDAIETELRRGGQVFFVHNRVKSIHAMERFLTRLLPGVSIGVAHGQMSERELEKVMVDFVRRRYQVLLCTTIIESGIDIPSCNTILIHRADRLGLAQLYQLRGRVGRARQRGYAYLLIPPGRAMSGDAVQRLKALQDNTSLGSGFKIAARDLEIRGAGNLLGKEQSGSVNAVGLHTYLELLQQAVATARGEVGGAPVPEIEIKTDAYIPADYIPDQRDRLLYYKRLSDATSEEEAMSLVEELEDLYGRSPEPVGQLVELIRTKALARGLWVTRVEPRRDGFCLTFHESTPVDPARLTRLVQRKPERFSLTNDGGLTVRLNREQRREPLPLVQTLLRRLR